ncbi:diguanylate cyclase domain-containing protein [Alcanivorax sp. DP30]|uniref:diguanylate cyclase domain-containing protein n=1 Tax=Alcanivorax sp. DP30 TaxID=2606217 RepID=UPI0013698488|nr:diguanylate cyclase [Alcanivorax sp. DP30]MZR62109.1 diguanylate cyclase [Alcanivorax sp. DP30]
MTAATAQSLAESHNQLAIKQALSLCQRHHHPVTLLAMDVEEPDSLLADIGETRMETLIRVLAEHLQQFKRCEDLLVINPDSHIMLVILPATDIHGGYCLAQRLISRLRGEEIQLDEFQIPISLRIALHGCENLDNSESQPLIDATLKLLQNPDNNQQLILSDTARQNLDTPSVPAKNSLAASLVAQASQTSDEDLLDTLKPAFSRLPEHERMRVVDHLLELSTRLESGLASH